MALVDPYAPCPCGSGEKYKWCCQKVEPFTERANRFYENGQVDAALETIDEGLRKHPDNTWLSVRKAAILVGRRQRELARPLLERVLQRQPAHVAAHNLMIRIELENESLTAAIAQLQQALWACRNQRPSGLGVMTHLIGVLLKEQGKYPAAIRHLVLSLFLAPSEEAGRAIGSFVQTIMWDQEITTWVKVEHSLSPPPEGLAAPVRERFEQAKDWAESGMWSAAATAFETLSTEKVCAEADRNLGLCRLWLADDAAAVAALRRYIAQIGATEEAVDLEGLCQQIEPLSEDDLVERVQLIWPLRNRDALLAALRFASDVKQMGLSRLDPSDDNSPEVEMFALLDRPPTTRSTGFQPAEIPRILGRVLVGLEVVALESFDDERLLPLADRFTALAGSAIAPAHPRTKVLGAVSRISLPFAWEWLLPRELDRREQDRLYRDEQARVLREVWVNWPMPFLKGRTPLQAARSGQFQVALRAAALTLDLVNSQLLMQSNSIGVRQTLGLDPEPAIDPDTVDVGELSPCRLHLVPADRLSDDRLVKLYERAQGMRLNVAAIRAARALIARPTLLEQRMGVFPVYSDLAMAAAWMFERAAAFDWVQKGREAESPARRAQNVAAWEMVEIQIKAFFEAPSEWVPDLAVLLNRYQKDPQASEIITRHLISMDLVRLVPNPDDPDGGYLVDTRPIQSLLAQFGPRLSTASGVLGVSATRGGIWTPESEPAGGTKGGAIWTPGSGAGLGQAGADKPRLHFPGR